MSTDISILFPPGSRPDGGTVGTGGTGGDREPTDTAARTAPDYFGDLNLDQIVGAVVAGREMYDLRPLFSERVGDPETVRYRHEVARDLEVEAVRDHISAFADSLDARRDRLLRASTTNRVLERGGWRFEAVELRLAAVDGLERGLALPEVSSRGLLAVRDHLAALRESPVIAALRDEARAVRAALSEVRYCTLLKGEKVTVTRYDGEVDYSAEVLAAFDRFKQGSAKDYRMDFTDTLEVNDVEYRILELVEKLFPEAFGALHQFCARHDDALDDVIGRVDREFQFYLAYSDYLAPLRAAGLPFCFPEVSDHSKEIAVRDTFDLALAAKLVARHTPVTVNDLELRGPERTLVISGPNQGGKTTLARAFGQLRHLAGIGCPVPGTDAQLFLFDRMFTHFGSEEDLADLTGKLEVDLIRIRGAVASATPRSIVIMNEIFASTTLQDALALGRRILASLGELDLLCVYVTFVDELATFDDSTVSMVSTVDPDDPAARTFKVVRRPADGLAYAVAIAERHGLSYDRMKERISS